MFSKGVHYTVRRTLCLWNRIALSMLLLQEKPSINDLTKLLLLTINHVKLSINCKTNQWRNFVGQSDKQFKIHFNILNLSSWLIFFPNFENRTFSILIFYKSFVLFAKQDWLKKIYTMHIHKNWGTYLTWKKHWKKKL